MNWHIPHKVIYASLPLNTWLIPYQCMQMMQSCQYMMTFFFWLKKVVTYDKNHKELMHQMRAALYIH